MNDKRMTHVWPWTRVVMGLFLCVCCGLPGCGPSKDQIRLARALSFRTVPQPDFGDGIAILDQYRTNERHRNEFVLYGMSETSLAMQAGYYDQADRVAIHAHQAVKKYQDAGRETRAAWGRESIKFFKGEPHERAMLTFYAGLARYIGGDYNNARIFFMQSLLATATRDDDMKEFREDFRLGHFWLGRAFLKLGQEDNAAVAFRRAATQLLYKGEARELKRIAKQRARRHKRELRAEAVCYKRASKGKRAVARAVDLSKGMKRDEMPVTLESAEDVNPVEQRAEDLQMFLTSDFQRSVNLILVIELGIGPIKYLHGRANALDDYRRNMYVERAADVYVDGHRGGAAFPLMDSYHQASTRGVKTRRGRQVGKVIAREVLSQVPFVSLLASSWNIQADARYWGSLPGRVHVYAARIAPGLHTVSVKFFDSADLYLPRFDITRFFINVPDSGDVVLVLRSVENQDNAYIVSGSMSD